MDKQGIVLKTEYDTKAAFLTLYMGEQERRFLFHTLCYGGMVIESGAHGKNKETAGMTVFLCMWEISKSNQTIWDGFPFPSLPISTVIGCNAHGGGKCPKMFRVYRRK